MNIQRYESEEWKKVAEVMHLNVFNEFRPAELNRIDFAIVVWNGDIPMGYITCVEYDSESVYIGYGGAFEHQRKTYSTLFAYKMMIDYLREKYVRANTLIENNNIVMLKMAMNVGFEVTGIRYFKGKVMLENSIEWSKDGILR